MRSGLKQVGENWVSSWLILIGDQSVIKDALLVKKSSLLMVSWIMTDYQPTKVKNTWIYAIYRCRKEPVWVHTRFLKGQYHVKLPNPYDFATMLVDLNT